MFELFFSPDTSGVMKAEPVSSCEKLATSILETEEYNVDSKEHKEMKARGIT